MRQLITALLICVLAVSAAALTGAEILAKVDAVFSVPSMWSVAQQMIVTPEGETRTFTIESYSMDGGRLQLSRYIKPERVAGTTFLLLDYGNDIWTYFADTGRTRQVAANARHRSVMGSNMTYEDMAFDGNMSGNYRAELLGSETHAGVDCHKLQLVPTYAFSSYSRLLLWVDKSTWVPLRVDYYDKGGEALKRMQVRDIRDTGGVPTPYFIEVRGLQDNSVTRMTILNVRYDLEIEESLFSTASLGR